MASKADYEATVSIMNGQLKKCLVQVDGLSIPGLVVPGMQEQYEMLSGMVSDFADHFEKRPGFNRQKFVMACFR
jgi:hypothetical protein